MTFRPFAFVVFAALLIATAISVCVTQCIPAQEPQQSAAETKFQVAQRDIFTAINLLEAYIRENPNGKDVAPAKVQLRSLKGLSPSSAAVSPVTLCSPEGFLEWYVASVDAQQERTVVTFKVTNTNDKRETNMYAFDTQPLAMFDNKGAFYPMQEAPAVPAGVRVQRRGSSRTVWWLQPQRVLALQVVFAPLAPDATGGRILFLQDTANGNTTPAEFSLLNKAQVVK
jgi:hypothetical protein